jgi:ribonuclease Z
MTQLVQPRLTNEPFSDPGLLLDCRFGRRAILFDLGDLSAMSPREILPVSHVFVSHMHMDHFVGFDTLLRLSLYRDKRLHLVGPPGLVDAVEAKLRAYTWNLLDERSPDFALLASDWTEEGFTVAAVFRARAAFRREHRTVPGALLPLEEPEFSIEAVTLDHGIPSLAFAFQETMRINVHKVRLDELGLPVGPWLTLAKRAARSGGDLDLEFTPMPDRRISLRTLLRENALTCAPGQRIVYATDLAFTPKNVTRLCALAQGADHLFIEGGFLDEDRELAASKRHLTAAQAGEIARIAAVSAAHQMHLSPRYSDREDDLRTEFERSFRPP